MNFFEKLKNRGKSSFPIAVGASATGKMVKMEQLSDPVFSSGAIGPCCGIDPQEGKIYAPIDGEVVTLMDSLHALGIKGAQGVEILIHVGIDTVNLNGKGFRAHVKAKDKIKKGQLLLEIDQAVIKEAGYLDTVITVVTNGSEFSSVEVMDQSDVQVGMDIMQIH
ncbi:PTS glucose transporter subunit IIA [Enterococcus sp. 669A]|uniref:PTS glucose transporter subunit IIA n=1 Tax=Candidatus Enterococcus moelleringii TaxID=2815325 RepID=A0ABS3L9H1_9ENTE|nr:PTS glucose transporter subunit IIA [Enterococcus sp. 669A]MBO1306262.1 PTS glucose transporter subunit IIA [Enterococcus sp. 669A]